jgi:hypothetical protein
MTLPKTYTGDAYEYKDVPQIIKGLIPRCTLVWLTGKWGTGKSFIAHDLAAHAANGLCWHGHKARQAKVLYIVAEGGAGMRKRQEAWATEFDMDTCVTYMDGPIDLTDDNQVAELAEYIANEGFDLVIFDTQHACSGGANENDAGEAAFIIDAVKSLKEGQPELTILLVHHDGETAGKVGRGSTAYAGAMDVILQVISEDPHADIALTVKKGKDLDPGVPVALRIRKVVLGRDSDGDAITSCVVEDGAGLDDAPKLTTLLKPDEGRTVLALSILMELSKPAVQTQLDELEEKGLAWSEPRRGNQGDLWYSGSGE